MSGKRISQEAFDEIVKENMETFDMGAEEAVASALEELKHQGVDTSNIIKLGPDVKLEEHPVAAATITLKQQTEQSDLDDSLVCGALKSLQDSFTEKTDGEELEQRAAVASKFELIPALIKLLTMVERGNALETAFVTLEAILVVLSNRKLFLDNGGPMVLMELLKKFENDFMVIEKAACVAAAASAQHEGNKSCLVEIGFPLTIHDLIMKEDPPDAALVAFSKAVYSFCNPDDPVPPASQAFRHARYLASNGVANTLMSIIKQRFSLGCTKEQWGNSGTAAIETLKTVKYLAANDDICQKLSQEGGVDICLMLWKGYDDVGEAVAAVGGVLRQMSQCDPIKHEIMEAGGAELLSRSLTLHVNDAMVLEVVIGLMANLVLRQPNFSKSFFDANCVAGLANVMQENVKKSRVLKQVCMCVRNMVCRVPDLRQAFLDADFEDMVRNTRVQHPKVCKDVATAVLRDLGLDNYS